VKLTLHLRHRSGKLLLVHGSTVVLGSESRWTHDHILLSHDSGSCALLGTIRLMPRTDIRGAVTPHPYAPKEAFTGTL
jgi:hypothetical protein